MANAPQVNSKSVDEVRNCRVSFASKLDTAEVISPTSSVSVTIVQGTSALAVSSIGVSTGALIVNGSSNPAGQVVTFVVSAGLAYTEYKLRVSGQTDAGQTLSTICRLDVAPST